MHVYGQAVKLRPAADSHSYNNLPVHMAEATLWWTACNVVVALLWMVVLSGGDEVC